MLNKLILLFILYPIITLAGPKYGYWEPLLNGFYVLLCLFVFAIEKNKV